MRKRGNRSGSWFSRLAGSAGWPKYAFVLVDGVIIIGVTLLVTSGIRPDRKLPEQEPQEYAEEQLTVNAPEDTSDTEREENTEDLPDPKQDAEDKTNPDDADHYAVEIDTEDQDQGDTSDPAGEKDGDVLPDDGTASDGGNDPAEPSGTQPAAEPETEPPAPETIPTETETPAPPEPTIPETTSPPPTETTSPPPVTALPYVGNIHALGQDQINAIRASYDCNGRGYGGITYYQAAPSVQSQMDSMGINLRTLVPGGNTVALTFQEGWEPGYTGQLLDILAQKGVKANFYITHGYAASRPDLVWRMINEGHTVGSHTYACPDTAIAYFSLEDIMNDAMRMQQYMHDTFGYDMHAYNYNSGAWSPGSAKMLSDMGYTVVLCSNSYSDYSAYDYIDPNVWLPQLEAGLIPGSIYAFHVTNPVTVQMIGPLIDYIRSMGYTFVLI